MKTKHNPEEAHIYLPNETSLLPNHFLILFENIFNFQNIPLKSNYPNIPSLQTCKLSLNQPSNHSIPNTLPIPLKFHTDSNSDNIPITTNPTSSTHNNAQLLDKPDTKDLHLTISTHNVRGFNMPAKRQSWQDYCTNHNISIACITETKISYKTKLSFYNNNQYTYYWANSESSIEGTAIMIRNHLKPHVHSCHTHLGGAVALDLFFKGNVKLRIISVYLSSTDMHRRNQTQNAVINWILQAQQSNLHPIILGDFNTQDNVYSSSSKFKLINFLHRSNMFDIGAHLNNTHYTWTNNHNKSRIDYIWTNSFNIQFLLSYNLDNSGTSTLSDHLILTTSWTFPNAFSKPPRLHTGISRRIFDYKAMSSDQWSEFSELSDQLFVQYNIPLSTNTQENLNKTWQNIQYCIKQVAIQTIPNKISRKRSYNHKYTPHCTALHNGLKKLGHLIKVIKNNNSNPHPTFINSQILLINSYTKCNLDPLISLDQNHTQPWLQHAYEIWKQVYKAYQMEHSLLL